MRRFVLACWSVCGVLGGAYAPAAEPAAPPAAAAPAQNGGNAPTFAEQFADFEARTKKLDELVAKVRATPPAERGPLIEQYNAQVTQLQERLPGLFAAAQATYAAAAKPDEQVTNLVLESVAWLESRDDYESAQNVLKLLADKKCDRPEMHDLAGIAAFVVNDYESAGDHFQAARASLKPGEQLSPQAENFSESLAEYKKLWSREQGLRAAEKKADDLPRVKIETSKGTLVVELFENEAPQTVANFISLVEQKFYDGLPFHRVLPNFMAQGGDPKGNGSGGPGYSIYCECGKAEHRDHFRGTLSMAHAGKDTGGSQFFLTFVPTPFLNGKHTVFGRVVDGFDVLAKLERVDPENPDPTVKPDTIVKATVLRKRNHEYAPTKVPGK